MSKMFEMAKDQYAAIGVDVEKAMEQLGEGAAVHPLLAG